MSRNRLPAVEAGDPQPEQEFHLRLAWRRVGEVKMYEELPTSSLLPSEPGVYRIRFLDAQGKRQHAYIGEAADVDDRIGVGHTGGPLRLWMSSTIEHGGSIEVDVLATHSALLPGGAANMRLDRRLSRLALEGAAAALDIQEFDDLLNSERIIDDQVPEDVRNPLPWWLRQK